MNLTALRPTATILVSSVAGGTGRSYHADLT